MKNGYNIPIRLIRLRGEVSCQCMLLSTYLWGVRLFTLLSLAVWLCVVLLLDPSRTGWFGIGLFFLSLFAMLIGFSTLFMTWLYRKGLGDISAAHYLGAAFRQSSLLSVFFIGLVYLQYERWLVWWNALLLLSAMLLLEISWRHIRRGTSAA